RGALARAQGAHDRRLAGPALPDPRGLARGASVKDRREERAVSVHPIRGMGDAFARTLDTVSGTVAGVLKGISWVASSSVEIVAEVIRGAIDGSLEAGADIGQAVKGIVAGVLEASQAK